MLPALYSRCWLGAFIIKLEALPFFKSPRHLFIRKKKMEAWTLHLFPYEFPPNWARPARMMKLITLCLFVAADLYIKTPRPNLALFSQIIFSISRWAHTLFLHCLFAITNASRWPVFVNEMFKSN